MTENWLLEESDEPTLPEDKDDALDDSTSKLIDEDIEEVDLPEYDPDFGDENADN